VRADLDAQVTAVAASALACDVDALLDEGACSVYEGRPATCRKYYSVSVATCRDAFKDTAAQLDAAIDAGDAFSIVTPTTIHGNLVAGSTYNRATPLPPAI